MIDGLSRSKGLQVIKISYVFYKQTTQIEYHVTKSEIRQAHAITFASVGGHHVMSQQYITRTKVSVGFEFWILLFCILGSFEMSSSRFGFSRRIDLLGPVWWMDDFHWFLRRIN